MKSAGRILGLLFCILCAGCLSWFFEKPTFVLKEVSVTRLSLMEVNFLFGIEVQNPNNFELKLRALEYAVFINDKELGKGTIEKEVLIAKASSTLVQIPLATNFRNLGNPIEMILMGRDLRYKIEGAAIIKASLGTTTVPFSKSGEIKIKK